MTTKLARLMWTTVTAGLLAACQGVVTTPAPTSAPAPAPTPTFVAKTPLPSASASPLPSAVGDIEFVPCTIAVHNGIPDATGDHDCRGSSDTTVVMPPGKGSYHVTDHPVLGGSITFRVKITNRRTTPLGPLTLLFVGPSDFLFYWTDAFKPTGCKPKCSYTTIGTDRLMATYVWSRSIAPGDTLELRATYKAKLTGYLFYQVGLYETSDLERQGFTGSLAEWRDVQSVVAP